MIRLRRFGLFAVVLTLMATGCRNQPAVDAQGNPERVRIAFFPNVTHAAALYASSTGMFQKAVGDRTAVEERVFNAGPLEIEALFAGEVDLGYIGPSPALNGFNKSRGEALWIVAGAASGGSGLVVRKGVPIRSIGDLKGRSVAVPQTGGSQDISLRHALSEAGLRGYDRGGDVQVMPFHSSDAYARMKEGAIDAAWVAEPWLSRMVVELEAELLVDEGDLWPDRRFSTAVVVVRQDFARRHPDLVKRLLEAHREAVRAVRDNPEEALSKISDRIAQASAGKKLPDNVLRPALERTEITDDLLPESILEFADRANALGYLREGRDGFGKVFSLPSGEGTVVTSEK
jgi:NitT/TauT family transport system substrate-binding protein